MWVHPFRHKSTKFWNVVVASSSRRGKNLLKTVCFVDFKCPEMTFSTKQHILWKWPSCLPCNFRHAIKSLCTHFYKKPFKRFSTSYQKFFECLHYELSNFVHILTSSMNEFWLQRFINRKTLFYNLISKLYSDIKL